MASYTLIASLDIVRVVAPNVKVDVVVATIKTHPTGIIATTFVSQAAVDAGTAGPILQTFAEGVEQIIAGGKAVGGSGTSGLDASGLQQYFVTFEVVYNPPGAPVGTVTADAVVPVDLLTEGAEFGSYSSIATADEIIDKAYGNLVALSQG